VEVEGVLMEHEKIKLATVVPVPDELRGEEVKAYVVLQDGESQDTLPPENIIEFAKEKLAYFKVPRYIEYTHDLPRTPSERIEKHKLISAKADLRIDSYDAADKIWR
jgi:crotonobetaine/carnitine-CoA ligase